MRSVQTRKSVFSIDNSLVNGHFILHLQCLILQLKVAYYSFMRVQEVYTINVQI